MLTLGSIVLWIGLAVGCWFILSYQTDSVPIHDSSRRYQELRRRPDDQEATVVRSFHYHRNADKWMKQCDPFRGTLELYDSKYDKVLFRRELV